MPQTETNLGELARGLRQAKSAAAGLASQLKRLGEEARAAPPRLISACTGGSCSSGAGGSAAGASGGIAGGLSGGADTLARGLAQSLTRSLSSALPLSLKSVLSGVLGSLTRGLTGLASSAAGGGLFGSLFGGLVGGGLSALLGKLTGDRPRVNVDGVVKAEILNFPRLSSLDFAANPASRLFGGRAVPRGAGFSVTVDYRGGAEDLVTAKVARRLSDLNALTGVV